MTDYCGILQCVLTSTVHYVKMKSVLQTNILSLAAESDLLETMWNYISSAYTA